jgi:hypothetical protein
MTKTALEDLLTSAYRLNVLANFLAYEVKKRKFHLDKWVDRTDHNFETPREVIKSLQKKGCGTTACAVGWAATIPEFRELGLNLRFADWGIDVTYKDFDGGSTAAMAFFKLSIEEVDELFMPSAYTRNDEKPSKKNVVAKLRQYARLKSKAANAAQ